MSIITSKGRLKKITRRVKIGINAITATIHPTAEMDHTPIKEDQRANAGV
jgi:hypothetical protein